MPNEPMVEPFKLEDASVRKSLRLKHLEAGNELIIPPLEDVGKSYEHMSKLR